MESSRSYVDHTYWLVNSLVTKAHFCESKHSVHLYAVHLSYHKVVETNQLTLAYH